ncbi:hypothetical protein [Methylobacterium sp.]|uniref:hypothetical protein n=1 Tax=Methylobacterium sp. TaxID=409 RepID=UPI003B5BC574
MSGPTSRRGFLSGLATLPLIGGSVALIGAPSASAEPLTKALVDSYDAWLEYERRFLQWELCGNRETVERLPLPYRSGLVGWETFDMIPHGNRGANFHGPDTAPASSRAALVLSAVGCDWRGR